MGVCVAHSVKLLTLGFVWGCDLRSWDGAPHRALCQALNLVQSLFEMISLSLSPIPPRLVHVCVFSLSTPYINK